MKAGNMNRQIGIQKKTVTYNSYNEPIEAWTTVRGVWAEVISTGGGEFYAAQKVNAQTSVIFKIRYATDITVKNRILYNSRLWEILSINDVNGGRTELQISCKEVV